MRQPYRMPPLVNRRDNDNQRRNRSSDKIWEPWEASNFKINPGPDELEGMRDGESWKRTAIIRFLEQPEDSDRPPAFHYRQMYCDRKYHMSTADLPGFDQKDVINYYWREAKDKYGWDSDEAKALRQSSKVAYQIIDFRHFHWDGKEVDQKNRKVYHLCESQGPNGDSRRCERCARGEERIFGGHKVITLTTPRYELLTAVHNELSEICINDDERFFLKEVYPGTVGFNCAACDEELLGERDINVMSSQDKTAYFNGIHECPSCGHTGFAREVAMIEIEEIPGDESSKIAAEAERGSMFYKQLKLTVTGTKITDNRTGKAKIDPRSLQWRFSHEGQQFSAIEDDLADYGIPDEEIDSLLESWDLAYHHRPYMLNPDKFDSHEDYVNEVLERQAAAIGKENPYKNDVPHSNGGRKSVPWRRS